jgi:hypothetical protein
MTICDWPAAIVQLFGLAKTPVGSPLTDRLTFPVKAFCPVRVTVASVPVDPIVTVSGLA